MSKYSASKAALRARNENRPHMASFYPSPLLLPV
jgi:hypothetical protein